MLHEILYQIIFILPTREYLFNDTAYVMYSWANKEKNVPELLPKGSFLYVLKEVQVDVL